MSFYLALTTCSEMLLTLPSQLVALVCLVKHLDILFNEERSFEADIWHIIKLSYYHFRDMTRLKCVLSHADAKILVRAVITTRFEKCNSLFSFLRNKACYVTSFQTCFLQRFMAIPFLMPHTFQKYQLHETGILWNNWTCNIVALANLFYFFSFLFFVILHISYKTGQIQPYFKSSQWHFTKTRDEIDVFITYAFHIHFTCFSDRISLLGLSTSLP